MICSPAVMPRKRRGKKETSHPAPERAEERGRNQPVVAHSADIQRAVAEYLGAQQKEILTISKEQYQGPLPHPDHLAQFEQILPGLADRIVAMSEKGLAHRQDMEAQIVRSSLRKEAVGQWFAFLVALAALGTGTYLISVGRSLEGMGTTLAALAGLIGVFIYGKRRGRRARPDHHARDAANVPSPDVPRVEHGQAD